VNKTAKRIEIENLDGQGTEAGNRAQLGRDDQCKNAKKSSTGYRVPKLEDEPSSVD
jgi:hypothetical protein